MESLIYAPSDGLETWKQRLTNPDEEWARANSAFETAVFWELGALQPRGMHPQLVSLLEQEKSLRGCELVASFPKHHVELPGGPNSPAADVWAIVRAPGTLMSISVDGIAGESFSETVGEWHKEAKQDKDKRLMFLCDQLGLTEPPHDEIRYQLVHHTVAALLEAERIGAPIAAMIVISFTDDPHARDDFGAFAKCLGGVDSPEMLQRIPAVKEHRPLFLGWMDAKLCTDEQIAAVEANSALLALG